MLVDSSYQEMINALIAIITRRTRFISFNPWHCASASQAWVTAYRWLKEWPYTSSKIKETPLSCEADCQKPTKDQTHRECLLLILNQALSFNYTLDLYEKDETVYAIKFFNWTKRTGV